MNLSSRVWSLVVVSLMIVPLVFLIAPDNARAYNEVTEPLDVYESIQPLSEYVLELENMSFNGRPFAMDPTNGEIYLASGDHLLDVWKYNSTTDQFTELYSGLSATGTFDVIKGGCVADNGNILFSRDHNTTIYRSTDGGTTFEPCLVVHTGGYSWDVVSTGSYVYAGEYGNPTVGTNCTIWGSDDYGATWSEVGYSYDDDGAFYQHIHRIAVDPYTGSIYVSIGDGQTQLLRSEGWGAAFEKATPQRRHTAIAFDANNIYFGDDPKGKIYVINRTTGSEFETRFLGHYVESSPVYEICVGQYGVIYARTYDDSLTANIAGIWASPNGIDWGMLVNLTYDALDPNIDIIAGMDGYVYYGAQFNNSRYLQDFYRFKDLNQTEAWALIRQAEPRPTTSSFTYSDGIRGANGTTSYAAFYQDAIDNAVLTITGVEVYNLFDDGILNEVHSLNQTWDAEGWGKLDSYFGPANMSRKFVTDFTHTGPYAIEIKTFNTSRGDKTGCMMLQRTIPVEYQMPNGTPFTVSGWFSGGYGNDTSPYYGGGCLGSIYMVYEDASSEYVGFFGGPGTGCMGAGGSAYGELENWTWGRAYLTYYPSSEKLLTQIKWTFNLYGNDTVYIDDIQAQWGEVFTPAISVSDWTGSTDINVTINGVQYQVGSLADGETAEIQLGTLSGFLALDWSINGSQCVNWSITGTHQVATEAALLAVEGNEIVASHIYGTAPTTLQFWNKGTKPVDVASFMTQGARGSIGFKAGAGSLVNVSFSYANRVATEGALVCAFTMEASSGTVPVQITGLYPNLKYMVRIDGGAGSSYLSDSGGNLNFTYSGSWSVHTFSLYVYFDGGAEGDQLIADFTYEVSGSQVNFFDDSSGYNIVDWAWDFGDGSASTLQDPKHSYREAGSYYVRLTVVNSDGETDTTTKLIPVGEPTQPFGLDLTQLVIAFGLIAAGFLVVVISRRPSGAVVGIAAIFFAIWILLWS